MSVNGLDSFGSFGKSFQEKILQALLSDHTWAQQMMEVMKPEYFEKQYLRYLFDIYAKHHNKYKCFPTLQLLITMARDELQEGNDEVLCMEIVQYVQHIKENPDTNDLPFVKDRALNFCKNQALKDALEEAVDLTKDEKYEAIVDVIKKAITVGTPNTVGHDFFEDLDARYNEDERFCVATGMPFIDAKEIMNGGLGKGEIGVIVAPTGVGKSHFLIQLGANAMRAGLNVLHYTFELREHKVALRYDSNLTGVAMSDIMENKPYVLEQYEKMEGLGRLIVKEYPTSSVTILTLKAHVEKIAITKDFKPDIILVDYADIMRSTRQYDALRHELKLVYEELRGFGMELGIPVWTASQSNRESTDSDIVGLDKISESFAKAMVCDFVITLSRKPLQKANGLGNLFVAKNRLGRDGILFPVRLDTARSIIEILDKDVDLDEFQKNRDNDLKQLVKDKWNEVATEKMVILKDGAPKKKVANDDE